MPKQIDKERMSQTILKNAMLLFAQKGYQGLSMRQLAKALGMTTGVLYHHFRNKDALYIEMIHLLADRDARDLSLQAAEVKSQAELIERFSLFLSDRAEYFHQILLLIFDHQRYIRDPDHAPNPEFERIFEPTLGVYIQALVNVLDLPSQEEAELILDYLIGCFTRALLYQRKPNFEYLPRLIRLLGLSEQLDSRNEENENALENV